jgi:hypothetical protein
MAKTEGRKGSSDSGVAGLIAFPRGLLFCFLVMAAIPFSIDYIQIRR